MLDDVERPTIENSVGENLSRIRTIENSVGEKSLENYKIR